MFNAKVSAVEVVFYQVIGEKCVPEGRIWLTTAPALCCLCLPEKDLKPMADRKAPDSHTPTHSHTQLKHMHAMAH